MPSSSSMDLTQISSILVDMKDEAYRQIYTILTLGKFYNFQILIYPWKTLQSFKEIFKTIYILSI